MDKVMQKLASEWEIEKTLYDLLLALAEQKIYDEDFQKGLMRLGEIAADKSRKPYLQARRAYDNGNYQEAMIAIKKAMAYRAIDHVYWKFAREVCRQLNDMAGMYYYSVLMSVNGGASGDSLSVPLDDPQLMQIIGQARINPCSEPFYVQMSYKGGEIDDGYGNLAGHYLEYENDAGYRDFCGVYNPRQWLNMRAELMALLNDMKVEPKGYCDLPFDVMKCRDEQSVQVECPPGKTCILPIAADQAGQQLYFIGDGIKRELYADKWEFSYFRLQEGTNIIQSNEKFHVAEPVWLKHDARRKRLVLNILADGLPWQVLKKQGYEAVPNLMRFFSAGVVFDNNFSVSEYTYPSLATMETGCYPYRTQIFNDNVALKMDPVFPVISHQMKALGYYCTNLMCDSAGMYNGVLRGFDRNILHAVTCHAYEAVERCIEHLDAFSEVDNYVYIHVSDAHPYNSNIKLAPYTQTSLPWDERILAEYGTSVHKKRNALNMTENQYSIQNMDRWLGMLFTYIERHYGEDEYVVNLFSDHGVSVYDDTNYLLSENQSGAAMMMRGAGIPKLGLVEELTSAVDFYLLMDKEMGFPIPFKADGILPKSFGGQGRRYAVSMSIYPGQTFKLCLRDLEYEFRLETTAFTQIGGLVDMRNYSVHIYRRDNHEEVFGQEIRERFMEEAVKHIKSFAIFD